MTDVIDRTTVPVAHVPYCHWGPVIAGAVAAAALASVLHAFAGAIGLAVNSAAPTWRDASIALWVLSGLYLILVADLWRWRLLGGPTSRTVVTRRS